MRSMMMVVLLITLCLALMAFGVKHQKKAPKAKAPAKVSFKKNVFPIIKQNCLPCHTEDEMNSSELFMESYADIMKGGKHGSPIVPGKADSSLMVKKLTSPPFGDPMPMKRKTPLSADTIEVIKKWINQGAKNN